MEVKITMAALFRDIEASLMAPKPLTVPQVSLGSTGANILQSELLILMCMMQRQLKSGVSQERFQLKENINKY